MAAKRGEDAVGCFADPVPHNMPLLFTTDPPVFGQTKPLVRAMSIDGQVGQYSGEPAGNTKVRSMAARDHHVGDPVCLLGRRGHLPRVLLIGPTHSVQ